LHLNVGVARGEALRADLWFHVDTHNARGFPDPLRPCRTLLAV
jgi:hypothetical protein